MTPADRRSVAKLARWKIIALEAAWGFLLAYFALRVTNKVFPGSIENLWRQFFGV